MDRKIGKLSVISDSILLCIPRDNFVRFIVVSCRYFSKCFCQPGKFCVLDLLSILPPQFGKLALLLTCTVNDLEPSGVGDCKAKAVSHCGGIESIQCLRCGAMNPQPVRILWTIEEHSANLLVSLFEEFRRRA